MLSSFVVKRVQHTTTLRRLLHTTTTDNQARFSGNEALLKSIDGLTDLTFPVYGYVGMTQFHSLYKYTPLIESPGSAFLVRKEKSSIGGVLISNIIGNWPLAVIMVCLAFAAGSIMWWLVRYTYLNHRYYKQH